MLVHIYLYSYQKQTIVPGLLGVVEAVWDSWNVDDCGLLSIDPLHLLLTEYDLEPWCCSFAYVLDRNRRIISTFVTCENLYISLQSYQIRTVLMGKHYITRAFKGENLPFPFIHSFIYFFLMLFTMYTYGFLLVGLWSFLCDNEDTCTFLCL